MLLISFVFKNEVVIYQGNSFTQFVSNFFVKNLESRICNKLVSSTNAGAKGLAIHTSQTNFTEQNVFKKFTKKQNDTRMKQPGILKEITVYVLRCTFLEGL